MGGAIIGAAVIAGGAAIYSGRQQAGAIDRATESQSILSREAMDREEAARNEQIRLLQEAVDKGEIDIIDAYDKAESIIKSTDTTGYEGYRDPWAFNMAKSYMENPEQIWDLPGVEFQYEKGNRALENIMSKTTGGGLSGAGIEAAIEYGQNFAATKIDQALSRIFPFINLAVAAEDTDINRNITRDTALANLATGKGTALANLRMAGAGGQAQATGNTARDVTQILSSLSANVGAAGVNQANITGNTVSNISNAITSGISDYAMYNAVGGEEGMKKLVSGVNRYSPNTNLYNFGTQFKVSP